MLWGPLILGLLVGIGGWMIYWAGLPAIGFVMGASFGGALGYLASAFIAAPAGIPICTGLGVVLGGVGGVLLVKALQIYFFFVTGLTLGAAFGYKLLAAHVFGLSSGSGGGWIVVAVCTVGGGLIMVWGRRFIVAFVTSVVGALIASLAFPPTWQNVALVVLLILFLSIQVGLVHRFVDQEEFDQRTRRRLRRREYPDVDTAD